MDGVPFALHPKFEAKLNSGTNVSSSLSSRLIHHR